MRRRRTGPGSDGSPQGVTWACVIGAAILASSGWLSWINAPLTGEIVVPSSRLAYLLGMAALVAAVWRSPLMAAATGATALSLAVYAFVSLAVADPALWTLVDEHLQYQRIVRFSLAHLPGNLGWAPEFREPVLLRTPLEQALVASSFLGSGFWLCVGGGALLVLQALRSDLRRAAAVVGATATVTTTVWLGLLAGPLLALVREEQATTSISLGDGRQAIQLCEEAFRLSPQMRSSNRLRLRMGQAFLLGGRPNEPSARLLLAAQHQQAGSLEAARAGLLTLSKTAPSPVAALASRRLAWLEASDGLKLYRRRQLASAIGIWEVALQHDPAQIQAQYFLSRAYFDAGRYQEAVDVCHLLLVRVRHRMVRSNVLANLGDVYSRLGQLDQARQAFEMASRLDPRDNFRIVKSLGGT